MVIRMIGSAVKLPLVTRADHFQPARILCRIACDAAPLIHAGVEGAHVPLEVMIVLLVGPLLPIEGTVFTVLVKGANLPVRNPLSECFDGLGRGLVGVDQAGDTQRAECEQEAYCSFHHNVYVVFSRTFRISHVME